MEGTNGVVAGQRATSSSPSAAVNDEGAALGQSTSHSKSKGKTAVRETKASPSSTARVTGKHKAAEDMGGDLANSQREPKKTNRQRSASPKGAANSSRPPPGSPDAISSSPPVSTPGSSKNTSPKAAAIRILASSPPSPSSGPPPSRRKLHAISTKLGLDSADGGSSSSSSRPKVSLSTMGIANHAPSPMSPIPDRPISSSGAFAAIDLGLSGERASAIEGQETTVMDSTQSPGENADIQQPLSVAALPGTAATDSSHPGSSSDDSSTFGTAHERESNTSTGSVIQGSISVDDISSSSSDLLPGATISRGSYHQCGTARRVKVYELQNEQWFDHGTGYCAGVYDEENDQALLVAKSEELCQYVSLAAEQRGQADESRSDGNVTQGSSSLDDITDQYIIVVTAELNPEGVLLCTSILREEIYQKQQDTLIVWTEPSGKDMALSFQEADGCNEIWEFLTEVQKHFKTAPDGESSDAGHMMSRELAFEDSFHTNDDILSMFETDVMLPEPTFSNVEQIDQALRDLSIRAPQLRERFAEWLVKTGYVKSLINVFQDAEFLEQLPVLHHLCSIMQNILLLNDNVMFEWILQEEIFFGVVGMLEYDPVFPRDKASFREYLNNPVRFKQVVPISDPEILAKIHHTYRLQYLKDVVLARILEDATFSIVQSILFFYQNDIINYCGGNQEFLRKLFGVFKVRGDGEGVLQKKRDAVLFLQQLCNMGKTIQLHSRIGLYHSLVEWGLIDVIEFAFLTKETTLKNAAAEMLMLIIEHDADSVRMSILDKKEAKKPSIMRILIDHLHEEEDMGIKSQIVEVLRILLDCGDSATVSPQAFMQQQIVANKQLPKADGEKFLTAFYDEDAERLFAPLRKLPDSSHIKNGARLPTASLEESALYGHLCDLLCFVNSCHAFRSQYFVITSEISKQVAALLQSKDKHVRCASLRFFKSCLSNNNQFVNRHHIKISLFDILLDIVDQEADRDNLVASACINYFEFMQQQNMKPLMNHLAEKHTEKLRKLADHPTAGGIFREILAQWEQAMEAASAAAAAAEAAKKANETGADTSSADQTAAEGSSRIRDQNRREANRATMTAEEENYFNEEDESTDRSLSSATTASTSATSESSKRHSLPGLVPYSDEDFEFDVIASGGGSGASTSSSEKAEGDRSLDEQSRTGKLREKRRRSDQVGSEEDGLVKLAAKRKLSDPDSEPNKLDPAPVAKKSKPTQLDDDAGGFVRSGDEDSNEAEGATSSSGTARSRKISLNLSTTGKRIAKSGNGTSGDQPDSALPAKTDEEAQR